MPGWYYAQNGQQSGPIELEQLKEMAAGGQLAGNDLVWTEGMANWQPASSVPSLLPETPVMQPAPVATAQTVAYETPLYQRSPHANLALTGMILSLASLALGGLGVLTAIAGLTCGWIALRGMKRTGENQNRGFAIAAVAVGGGFLGLVLIAVAVLITIALKLR